MPTPVDGINRATDFNLDRLVLVGTSGLPVDIREIVYELNLFEDLFGNTMSGSILVNDTQNLINLLPIIGMEFLSVTITKPTSPWKLDKTFRVYDITNRRRSSSGSEDYILHFCSEEAILSESQKISKSYKGQTVSAIVKDICTSFLKVDPKKFPSTAITDTQGNFDVVIPYWTPFYAINWLCRMARTAQAPGCSFVFFEDSESYHFSSIELLSQQEPLQSINFGPMNFYGEKNDKSDTQLRYESGYNYELLRSPDMIRSLGSGAYSGKLTMVDLLSQKISVSSVNSAALFAQTKHVNPYNYIQLSPDRTKKPVTEKFDSFFRVSSSYLKPDTWMLQRNAYLSGLHNFQIKVEVPGNIYLRAGQVVTLNLPSGAVATDQEKPMDDIFSGNYIITAINHKIDRTKYTCTLELSKDSVKIPMPNALGTNQVINRVREL